MTNDNCLEGIACSKCGNDARLTIAVSTLADVTDDGAETFGDMHWDDASFTECPECGHRGALGEFRVPTEEETTNQPRKE
jgi:DNA-directed RNA polymerase subunit RPC12/RpoP